MAAPHSPSPIAGTRVWENLRAAFADLLEGKEAIAETLICALLAGGHVLFEDVPGVGKTTLVRAIARLLGLDMKRIQCTSDLLPSDIIGIEIYNGNENAFVFHRGPLFSHVLLADELNRASPRTQSALLEAMAEGAVTVGRTSHTLPRPFFVFATQNPTDAIGTYPLPESQLDRFSAKIKLDYPVDARERRIFGQAASDPLASIPENLVNPTQLADLQAATEKVFLSDKALAYAKRFVDATRAHEAIRVGVSTRGGVLWVRMARARAVLQGREYLVPDDLMALASACLAHRVIARSGGDARPVIDNLLSTIDVE